MKFVVFAAMVLLASASHGSETLTAEPDQSSYHFVSHYSVAINATASEVWKHLIDLDSWMYEFELTREAGVPGQAGEVRRLYGGQDFFVELTKVIPNQLLVFANLPVTLNDESSTGVAVITLSDSGKGTTVNLTMSRRYSWSKSEPNPQRAMRESKEFQERTRAMWQDRFLARLKSLSEMRR